MTDRRRTIRWPQICAFLLAVVTIVALAVFCAFLLASTNAITQLCIDKLGQT